MFVRSFSMLKLSFLDGNLIGVCSLPDVDAEVGLISCDGVSCCQRVKLSILLTECTGIETDSSQRLWR